MTAHEHDYDARGDCRAPGCSVRAVGGPPVTAPQPRPRDELVELISGLLAGPGGVSPRGIAESIRGRWLVLDPDDEATVERMANAMCRATEDVDLRDCGRPVIEMFENEARAAIAALRGSR